MCCNDKKHAKTGHYSMPPGAMEPMPEGMPNGSMSSNRAADASHAMPTGNMLPSTQEAMPAGSMHEVGNGMPEGRMQEPTKGKMPTGAMAAPATRPNGTVPH